MKNQKKLKKWAVHSPMNYNHKYHLVEAEIARIKGKEQTSRHHYRLAIKLAHDNKFFNEKALAQELAAKFWLGMNEDDIAALYMKKAHHTYRMWGATAKVTQIEEKYDRLLESKNTSIEKTDSTSKGLDLLSIIKSSNAILSVLNIEDLLKRIIEIAIENAGATNGVLLLKKGNEFLIEAEQNSHGAVTVMQAQPIDKTSNLAVSAINYILRTKHYIVLDDAANFGDYTSDPWIKKNRIKSLLISSILHQGEMIGVFYAENNMVKGVFTKERLDTLRVLSTQAAISLKNAQLFENIKHAENEVRELNVSLEKRVAERTETLNQTLEKVNDANQYIMSSIRYSSMIQRSLLPDPVQIADIIPDSFFIWQPRSIIGGDIYYVEKFGNNFVIAVIDCTGHGIPGAFMTMIASSGLRRIVNEEANNSPTSILKKLNYIVKTSLQQDKEHSQSNDGLDASVCYYDSKTDDLKFAGARLPLYYICDNELIIIKGDKASIGYVSSNLDYQFTEHTIHNASNTCFYMASDGYTDQLGGENNYRLGSKIFKDLILENHKKSFDIQKELLCTTYDHHMGINERTDDVTVIGFRPRRDNI
jgi:serine phosphatase RsbU (regulator of sigma subunit)